VRSEPHRGAGPIAACRPMRDSLALSPARSTPPTASTAVPIHANGQRPQLGHAGRSTIAGRSPTPTSTECRRSRGTSDDRDYRPAPRGSCLERLRDRRTTCADRRPTLSRCRGCPAGRSRWAPVRAAPYPEARRLRARTSRNARDRCVPCSGPPPALPPNAQTARYWLGRTARQKVGRVEEKSRGGLALTGTTPPFGGRFLRHPNLLVWCAAQSAADQPGEGVVVTDRDRAVLRGSRSSAR
jgi:hypothetical protein